MQVEDVMIRQARAEDLPSIVAMLADDMLGKTREDSSLPLDEGYLAAFAAIEAAPNDHLYVVECGGRIAGTFQLSFLPGLSRKGMWRAQIEGVRVAASHRGHGLGERMIGRAVDLARQHGCGLVQLTTDRSRLDAQRFYERLGFEATHVGMKLVLDLKP